MAGRITDWNDEKGFGFIEPGGGGDRAFVHIKAFPRGSRRPVAGDPVSYVLDRDERGRPRAADVRHARPRASPPRQPLRLPRAALGSAALLGAAALATTAMVPAMLPLAVATLGLVAYVAYWFDKSAARRGGQRIPESSLHLLGLAGGWPGALVAQQQFRHKTAKVSFQAVFWITVVLNLVALAWLVRSGRLAVLAILLGH